MIKAEEVAALYIEIGYAGWALVYAVEEGGMKAPEGEAWERLRGLVLKLDAILDGRGLAAGTEGDGQA